MKKNPWFWIVGITGLILDQLTKYWIVKTFGEPGHSLPLWLGVFHLTYVTNTGAAFSVFRGGAGWLKWLSLGVSMGLMSYAWFASRFKLTEQLGFGFILAGALGNGLDRFFKSCILDGQVYNGCVIDFLDFRLINFPVFNVADVSINVGIIFLLIASFPLNNSRKKKSNH